ncbi:MAG: M13 family peptidase [Gemmatimonadales bacterium]|jgi:predicted metalloendopeptidase|nr:MAG: M13 family peptidase [Gemmatimonadales bacterium]
MRNVFRRSLFLAVLGVATATALPTAMVAQEAALVAGLDTAGMDRSVKPGDNFYDYTNGTWTRDTPIPADRSSYGSFAILAGQIDERVAGLIQETAKSKAPTGSEAQMVGDYYSSFMDVAAIDAAGLTPLRPTLDSIAAISNRTQLAYFLGTTLRADMDAMNATNLYTGNLFGLWVAQDLDDPTQYSPFLLQGGLGMPDRSYYVDSSAGMAAIRTKYQQYIAGTLDLAGIPGADAKATAIMQLETQMAQAHWTREATGDFAKGNNHWTRAEFRTKAPGLDWEIYFAAAELSKPARFVVWQPSAFTGLSALAKSVPLDTWKDYLTFHAIQARTAVLPAAFDQQSFAFYGMVLSGAQVQRDRWKRAVGATNGALGFAVGKLYTARHFSPAQKERAEAMVANIIAAFSARVDQLAWMAPSTKKEAHAKLAVLKVGVGYPDTWPSYTGLRIVPGDAYGNAERAGVYHLQARLKMLGQPVDRGEWVMTPQTVNAVNMPAMNAMNFPAAILEPPFFDPNRAAIMDYGAMGTVIGHEISHSFDNLGALFDATGRLHNWWTPEDLTHFEASAAQLVAQYTAYRPFPDLAVNGQQTLSENIADLAGIAAAYDAYRMSLGGAEAPVIDGFTGDQQFFVSFGQIWRTKYREPALRQRVLTDGHSPGEYRAFTVRNVDAWYPSFDVQPGQTLYLSPADRVRVW